MARYSRRGGHEAEDDNDWRAPESPILRQDTAGGGFFSNSSNNFIQGGAFTVQNDVLILQRAKKSELDTLMEHVAPSAMHAGSGLEAPRCHERTRTAVLDEIAAWIAQAPARRAAWTLWLNGAAGAGKSSICETVAQLGAARGVLVAAFFFFRTDPARNSLNCVAATLAYQLMRLVPATRERILQNIVADPLVFELGLDMQLEALVMQPLRWLQSSGQIPDAAWRLVFIIDGIDECNGAGDQVSLVRIIARLLAGKDLPLLVLFSSRAENQLKMAFRAPGIARILRHMPLDNNYLPEKDILLFLQDSFATVKLTHPFGYTIDEAWPATEVLQEIVDKSSGQFIYASVVVKFVSNPHGHPARQLEIIRGLRPCGRATPFAELDALYRHIFSQVQDIALTTTLLAYITIGQGVPDITDIAWFFGLQQADIHLAFAELVSVVSTSEHRQVRFLHASLPDFLFDPERSLEYYIHVPTWSAKLASLWFKNIASGEITKWHPKPLLNFLKGAECTPALRECFLDFDPSHIPDSTYYREQYRTAMRAVLAGGDAGKTPNQTPDLRSDARWQKLATWLSL